MKHLDELEEHYTSVVGAEPEFGTMTSTEGTTVGIFRWPKESSRMGVTERADDLLPDLQLKDGRHITFLDALPVFQEEAEFRYGNRADELLGMWGEWEVASWDLDRELHPSLRKSKASRLVAALRRRRR